MCKAKDCMYYKYHCMVKDQCEDYCCEDYVKSLEPTERKQTLYERTKAAVYATGNKWAIENFNATH